MANEGDRRRNPKTGQTATFTGGQWVLDGPAAPQSIQTKPADPRLPIQLQREEVGLVRDRNQAAASVLDPRISEAQARKAEADARIAEANAAQGKQITESEQARQGRVADIEAATELMMDVARRYVGGYQGGDLLDSLGESLPDWMSGQNQAFNSKAAGLADTALAGFKRPGSGTQTDPDAARFVQANQPEAQVKDATNEARLDTLQTRLNANRKQMGLPPIDWRKAADVPPPPRDEQPPLSNVQINKDGGSTIEVDPTRRAIAGRLGQMLVGSASDKEITDYVRGVGIDPNSPDITRALQFRRTDDFRKWKQVNPGKSYPFGEGFFTKEVPQSGAGAILNSIADTTLGNFAIQAGQAVTGNRLDNWSDNPELTQSGIEQMRRERPYSSIAGDMAGQGMAYSAGGRAFGLAGRVLPQGGRLAAFINPARAGGAFTPRAVVGDAAYGAYSGSGDGDGSASDILGGMAGSAGGGIAGRGAFNLLGRGFRGVTDPNVRQMHDSGMLMTVGQILRGNRENPGMLTVTGIEDRLGGLPITGEVIGAARYRGAESANRAAFRQGGEPIGFNPNQTGPAGVGQLQGATRQAYGDALNNAPLDFNDPQYLADLAAARARGAELPEPHGPNIDYTLGTTVPGITNANQIPAGQRFQAAREAIRGERAGTTGPLQDPARAVYTGAEGALDDLAARQAPGVMPALTAADQAYRNQSILGDAVMSAQARPDQLFTPNQLLTADKNNTIKFGGRNAARAGNTPFGDFGRAWQDVAGNVIPDSGTAGRAMLLSGGGGLAAGAGIGAGVGAANDPSASGAISGAGSGMTNAAIIGALLAAPYSRTGQRALQNVLLERPDWMRALGDRVLNSRLPQVGGLFGATALPYYTTEGY